MLPSMSQTEKDALEAGTVWWDGELFTGGPDWEKLLSAATAAPVGGRAGVHRRPVRRAVPDDRRLGHHASSRRPAAAPVGLHQEQGLLRDDHPEEVRRPGVLRVRALVRAGETLEPLRRRRLDRRGAELARPRRTAASLRHRGAAQSLPAAPGTRRGSALLRAHRSARRLGRRVDSGHRHRVQGHVRGPRDRRRAPQLLQALHHARAGRDGDRPRVQAVRSRSPARRRAHRLRHHLRADSAPHARASRSAVGTSR